MTAPKHTYEDLFARLVRAKLWVEKRLRKHDDRCMSELDPYGAPCSCGATEHNAQFDDLMEELKL